MIFIVIIILGLLLFFVNLLKKIAQNLRSKSIQKSAEKNIEPLKG